MHMYIRITYNSPERRRLSIMFMLLKRTLPPLILELRTFAIIFALERGHNNPGEIDVFLNVLPPITFTKSLYSLFVL